eukprot:TRINITY_DN4473_c0_g2_i1.p1 TRINITY_DN4473_c0_g2~~TRINITY_DN4473_c0_g2_i1.p1  ORF type:complete len:1111 (+),score=228.72 TRINITY_DN4473_c0_g2_i1:384-3716(+)
MAVGEAHQARAGATAAVSETSARASSTAVVARQRGQKRHAAAANADIVVVSKQSKAAKPVSRTAPSGAPSGGPRHSATRREEKELLNAVKEGAVERVRELLSAGAPAQVVMEPTGQNLAFFAAGLPFSKTEASSSSSSSRLSGAVGAAASARSASSQGATLLRLLAQFGVNLATTDSMSQTPLFYAAREGNLENCSFLIECQCDPDQIDANAQTPIFYSARNGHSRCADLLISRSCTADRPDRHGQSPLFWAAHWGHTDFTRLLLENRGDVTRTDTAGQTCLFRAAANCTSLVLDAACDVCHRDSMGRTALFLAAEFGDVERMRLLVSRGAQPDATDSSGATCLFHGARHGHLEACTVIVEEFRVDPLHQDFNGRLARQASDIYHHSTVSEYLVSVAADRGTQLFGDPMRAVQRGTAKRTRAKAGAKKATAGAVAPVVRAAGRATAATAIASGGVVGGGGTGGSGVTGNATSATDAAAVAALAAVRANVPQRAAQAAVAAAVAAAAPGVDSSPKLGRKLFAAVSLGDLSEVRAVLAARGDPKTVLIPRGQNLVFTAAAREKDACEVCKLLVQRQVDPTAVDTQLQQTALFFAVRPLTPSAVPTRVAEKAAGDGACARFLLTEKCSPHHVDLHGQTPMFYAVKREAADCSEALIEAKASVNHTDALRQSPCFFAAQANSVECIGALIRARADVNCTDNAGQTSLFRVSSRPAAQLLLESACCVNQRDNSGLTPLCVAASIGSSAVVRVLVAANGDVHSEDVSGDSVLYHAARGREPVEMCRILMGEFGADPNRKNKRGDTVADSLRKLQATLPHTVSSQVRKVVDTLRRFAPKAGAPARPSLTKPVVSKIEQAVAARKHRPALADKAIEVKKQRQSSPEKADEPSAPEAIVPTTDQQASPKAAKESALEAIVVKRQRHASPEQDKERSPSEAIVVKRQRQASPEQDKERSPSEAIVVKRQRQASPEQDKERSPSEVIVARRQRHAPPEKANERSASEAIVAQSQRHASPEDGKDGSASEVIVVRRKRQASPEKAKESAPEAVAAKRPRLPSPEKVKEQSPLKAHRRKYFWVFDDPRSLGRTLEPGSQAYAAAVRALCEQCPWLDGWKSPDT